MLKMRKGVDVNKNVVAFVLLSGAQSMHPSYEANDIDHKGHIKENLTDLHNDELKKEWQDAKKKLEENFEKSVSQGKNKQTKSTGIIKEALRKAAKKEERFASSFRKWRDEFEKLKKKHAEMEIFKAEKILELMIQEEEECNDGCNDVDSL